MSDAIASADAFACSCGRLIAAEDVNHGDFLTCQRCQKETLVYAFPALIRPLADGSSGELVLDGQGATCFHHSDRVAVVACSSCGRFLCALCDVDFDGRHLCPGCVESGRSKGKLSQLENRRVLYDSIALSVSLVPLLIFYFTIFTAPITLYLAIRYRNAPSSILPRTRLRWFFAILSASLQMAGWVGLGIYLVVS